MKILAIDTSAQSCGVAIVSDQSLIAETTLSIKQTHSKHLIQIMDMLMVLSNLNINDIDGFAVTVGPGSFTGLRIGISSIKGLALAANKPVVGVSSLDAIAMQAHGCPYSVCSLLNALKGEVYFAHYRFKEGILKKETDEQVASVEEAICNINGQCLFIGDGVTMYKKIIVEKVGNFAHFASFLQNTIKASTVAFLGMKKFIENDTDNIAMLSPRYVRKPYFALVNK